MPEYSAGILPFRFDYAKRLHVLIVHPGGPYWAKKDDGAWSIAKGEYQPGVEDPFRAAAREFTEELGREPPQGDPIALGEVRQAGGKRVSAWAIHGDVDATVITSNSFEMEWPPKSGRMRSFPEIDRALWCTLAEARRKLLTAQTPFLDRLAEELRRRARQTE